MITIATFDNQALAHIAKGRLEAEGIPAEIADDHLIQTDWLYGVALGGIKVQVPEAHAARAHSILEQDYSGELHPEPEEEPTVAEEPRPMDPLANDPASAPDHGTDVGKWAALVHLAAFAGLFVPLGNLLGTLFAWLGRRGVAPEVDRAGREAVNFQISITLYALAALAMASPSVAYPVILGLFFLDTILVLYAALRAHRHQPFRYPLTIRLLT
ncbi:MAG: DUF4870 domain-containing protein [Thiohalorhabdus sp.]|uniref:DUF4870 domain-containing protein n=1 Tax=Thiohalorhabdus sp. TaxID=3094134 RepID=UPI00397EE5A1